MRVWQIALDSQTHMKNMHFKHKLILIGLSKIGTFLYWIIRHKYKRIYKKWFGVLI
jgi:hypothetical protein